MIDMKTRDALMLPTGDSLTAPRLALAQRTAVPSCGDSAPHSEEHRRVLCLLRGFSGLLKNISEKGLSKPARHSRMRDMKMAGALMLPTDDGLVAPRLALGQQPATPVHNLRGGGLIAH